MRIIGGEWRGRKIEEPRGRGVTRPTTDRVRGVRIYGHVGIRFRFGRGSCWTPWRLRCLGLEMLSRGARSSRRLRSIARRAAHYQEYRVACRDCKRWRVTGDMLTSASRGRTGGL
ncbi:MAG: RsmD family RNA methyltransferase [Collinsella aerofaciens]